MKQIVITLIACMLTASANAQFLGGFFSQKKENRKLLAQQIAALQVYKTYVKKGYDIISKGVGIINKIKSGDFNLHRDFFGALKLVNPKIKKYDKVAGLIALDVESVAQLKKVIVMSGSELFSSRENRYIRQVADQMLQVLADTVDELILIISDNQVEMKDDERLKRIDNLYEKAEDQFSFIRNFSHEVSLMKWFKEKENGEVKSSRFLQGIEKE